MIHVLEKHIADKIAAGEVIDRPVSIIKERWRIPSMQVLIRSQWRSETAESPISALQTTEAVSKRETWRRLFYVMPPARSAASGIWTPSAPWGFRGEALASICAVARVELISKTADAKMGRRVVTEGSEILANEGIGCPEGTTVTVQDLFYNVPARQKFLSSDNGESRRIIDMVSRIALAYGDVRFTLINGKNRFLPLAGKAISTTPSSAFTAVIQDVIFCRWNAPAGILSSKGSCPRHRRRPSSRSRQDLLRQRQGHIQ